MVRSGSISDKYSYLSDFLEQVKFKVQQDDVVVWSECKSIYEELIRIPTWNTTNLRATIDRNKLLGDDITFTEHERSYYVSSKYMTSGIMNKLQELFSKNQKTTIVTGSTGSPSHIRVQNTSFNTDSSQHPLESRSQRAACPGFEPSSAAVEYCSSSNTLVSGDSSIVATMYGEVKYRSHKCRLYLLGKEQMCTFCSDTKKVIDQRGRRAETSVETGSTRGRNAASTNTIALKDAKIQQLQQSLYQSNSTIKKQQKVIDDMFDNNVDAQDVDHIERENKKRIFWKTCNALSKAETNGFFFMLLESQLENLVKTTPFLHRFHDEIKHFWKYYRHNAGPKAIDILRGVLTKDGPFKYNMYIPSNSTLDKIEDIGSYGAPDTERVKEILASLEQHVSETGCKEYIISFDGIIVIPRYKYNEGLDLVLGGSEVLTPEQYVAKSKDALDDDLGNEVVQFTLQSLDGLITIRAGHWVKPDRLNSVSFIVSKLKCVVDTLYKKGVCEIIASCSDGDLATDAIEYLMDRYTRGKNGTPWFHFFDFSHVLKAARNALLNRYLQPGDHKFHMKELIQLCIKNASAPIDTLSFIKDSWVNPPDIMKMKPCIELTSPSVTQILKKLPDCFTKDERSMAEDLSVYLSQIRKLYDCFMDLSLSQDAVLTMLYGKANPMDTVTPGNLLTYISEWNGSTSKYKLASQTSRHICVTVYNLHKIIEYLSDCGITYELRRSVLSTLAVELGFCITRGMQAYVTASEYSTLSGRTEWDQRVMCTSVDSRLFSMPSDVTQPSKYYNACVVHYSNMPQLQHKRSSVDKKGQHSNQVMSDMRTKLASQGESTGHKKVRSHCNTSHKQMLYPCDVPDCPHKDFNYPASLATHLHVVHGVPAKQADAKVKAMRLQKMQEIIEERSAERRKSAAVSGLRMSTIEDGAIGEDEEIEIEAMNYQSQDAQDNSQYEEFDIGKAKGDQIFPITDELLQYVEHLENEFYFMQLEIQDHPDKYKDECVQYRYGLKQVKPVVICYLDCETMNLHPFPKGCPIEISVRVAGMKPDNILCSRFNPSPYLTDNDWSDESISIHGIHPQEVVGQPFIEYGIQALYRLMTIENRCRVIAVAFNAPFDNSRITSCAEKMVPNLEEYDVTWYDARELIGQEFICDDEGRQIDRTGKLPNIFQHRLKDIEQIDMFKVHGSRYDTYMLQRLLFHKYETDENILIEIIRSITSRKGDGCDCTTGCTNCSCTKEGTGCSASCLCFGCQNPVQQRPAYTLPCEYDKLTDVVINKLKKHEIQMFLFDQKCVIIGSKADLVQRLKSVVAGNPVPRINRTLSIEDTLTRDDVMKMTKTVCLTHLEKRFGKTRDVSNTVGSLRYELLDSLNFLQPGDEEMKKAKKYKTRKKSNKKQQAVKPSSSTTNGKKKRSASEIDADNSQAARPKKQRSNSFCNTSI